MFYTQNRPLNGTLTDIPRHCEGIICGHEKSTIKRGDDKKVKISITGNLKKWMMQTTQSVLKKEA